MNCQNISWSIIILSMLIIGMGASIASLCYSKLNNCVSINVPVDLLTLAGIGSIDEAILNKLWLTNFKNLNGKIFLDCAEKGIYTDSQEYKYNEYIQKNIFVTPNSYNLAQKFSRNIINEVKNLILTNIGTDSSQYSVVFTSSPTKAFEMLGTNFKWNQDSTFWYNYSTHSSIIGIRRIAGKYNANYLPLFPQNLSNYERRSVEFDKDIEVNSILSKPPTNMLILPLMNDFHGALFPKGVIRAMLNDTNNLFETGESSIIVGDATTYAAHHTFNLSKVPLHAVVLSFNKMFGLADLSAIVINNQILPFFKEGLSKYVGGSEKNGKSELRNDDYLPMHQIVALKYGYELYKVFTMQAIEERIFDLTQYLYDNLLLLNNEKTNLTSTNVTNRKLNVSIKRHLDIYGNHGKRDINTQGGILSFKILNYSNKNAVQQLLQKKIIVGFGEFNDPGSLIESTRITESIYQEKKINSTTKDIDEFGVIRVSPSWATSYNDIDKFVDHVKELITAP